MACFLYVEKQGGRKSKNNCLTVENRGRKSKNNCLTVENSKNDCLTVENSKNPSPYRTSIKGKRENSRTVRTHHHILYRTNI